MKELREITWGHMSRTDKRCVAAMCVLIALTGLFDNVTEAKLGIKKDPTAAGTTVESSVSTEGTNKNHVYSITELSRGQGGK